MACPERVSVLLHELVETIEEATDRIMDSLVRALECDWIDASEHEPFTHFFMDYEGGIMGAVLFRLVDGLADDYSCWALLDTEAQGLQIWEDKHGIPAYLVLAFKDVTRCMRAHQVIKQSFDV